MLEKLKRTEIIQRAEIFVASASTVEEFVVRAEIMMKKKYISQIDRILIEYFSLESVLSASASLRSSIFFSRLIENYIRSKEDKLKFLQTIAETGYLEGMKKFSEKVDLSDLDASDFESILESAIWKGGLKVTKWIIEESNWNIGALKNQTQAFKRALGDRQIDTVRYMIKKGADVVSDPSIRAAIKNSRDLFAEAIADAIDSRKAPYSEEELPKEVRCHVEKYL